MFTVKDNEETSAIQDGDHADDYYDMDSEWEEAACAAMDTVDMAFAMLQLQTLSPWLSQYDKDMQMDQELCAFLDMYDANTQIKTVHGQTMDNYSA